MFTAASQPGKECASGLNSILRIARESDYRVLNTFGPEIGSVGVRRGRLCGSIWCFAHGIRKLTELEQHSTAN